MSALEPLAEKLPLTIDTVNWMPCHQTMAGSFPKKLSSFHPEMALFRNLPPASPERERPACHARHERAGGGQAASIYGIVCAAYHLYASAQSLDFLDFAKNCSFLNWKLELMPIVGDFHFRMGTAKNPDTLIFVRYQ